MTLNITVFLSFDNQKRGIIVRERFYGNKTSLVVCLSQQNFFQLVCYGERLKPAVSAGIDQTRFKDLLRKADSLIHLGEPFLGHLTRVGIRVIPGKFLKQQLGAGLIPYVIK